VGRIGPNDMLQADSRNGRSSRQNLPHLLPMPPQDYEKLSALIPTMLEVEDHPEARTHARLLKLVCSHWQSYISLKNRIEELRWCLWKLEAVPNQLQDLYTSVARYWREGNRLSWDAIDIASLDRTPPSTGVPAIKGGETIHGTRVDPLPLLMFSGYAKVTKPSESGSSDRLRRFLIGVILAQKDLKPRGSRILPSEALSIHLEHYDLGGVGPGHTLQRSFSTIAIIAEHAEHRVHLFTTRLETIGTHYAGDEYLSFFLKECYNDTETVYNILAAAVRYAPSVWYETFEGRLDHPRARWCYSNFETLYYYSRHTSLVAIAESHEDDGVIPMLIEIFEKHVKRTLIDPFEKHDRARSSRAVILRGMDGYRRKLKQEVVDNDVWTSAMQRGEMSGPEAYAGNSTKESVGDSGSVLHEITTYGTATIGDLLLGIRDSV
jgi:hypothetical protein